MTLRTIRTIECRDCSRALEIEGSGAYGRLRRDSLCESCRELLRPLGDRFVPIRAEELRRLCEGGEDAIDIPRKGVAS